MCSGQDRRFMDCVDALTEEQFRQHRLSQGAIAKAPGPLAGRRILVDSLLADGERGSSGRVYSWSRERLREKQAESSAKSALSRHADARRTPAARQAGFRDEDEKPIAVWQALLCRQPQYRSPRAGDGDHAHAVRRADVWAGLPELLAGHLITRTVAHIGHLSICGRIKILNPALIYMKEKRLICLVVQQPFEADRKLKLL